MCCVGKWVAASVITALVACAGYVQFTSVDAAQPPDAKEAKETKVDLTALREAVNVAMKRGDNVDEIARALDAFAKVAPTVKSGTVPPELQALRDAVDAAAKKGENVEAITKELVAVEMIVAGKSLAKPRPEPRPEPADPKPVFPNAPFPAFPNQGGLPGGIDVEAFNKAMELRRKAIELMLKNPRDPEAKKMLQEANEMMLKAARGIGANPLMPLLPDVGRVPDRARLGIRMERVPAVAAEQLGLEPNTGIVVSLVMPDSAAEKAGLKVHDIILEFAGKPVNDNPEDFTRRVGEVKNGEKVDIVVLRKGKKVEVKGVELPEAAKRPAADLLLPNLFPELPMNPAANPAPRRGGLPAGFTAVEYTTGNGSFTLKAKKGEAKFTLTGTLDDGKPTLTNVTIEDAGKTHTADAVSKLPEAYQEDAGVLLKTIGPRPRRD
jgi:hypothetical protein